MNDEPCYWRSLLPNHSIIYFPLRSNAKSLLQGRAINSVRNRLKLAALLHDEIYIEEGIWIANAGPRGSQDYWFYSDDPAKRKWQHPRSRGLAQKSDFSLAMKPDNTENARFVEILRSSTSISWHATFEPFKDEIPSRLKWIQFGHIKDQTTDKQLAQKWINLQALGQSSPPSDTKFDHQLVTKSAYLDLIMSARIGSVVNMEMYHRTFISELLQNGTAAPILGNHSLKVQFPSIVDLSWSQVDELRKHSAIRYYRDALREIEADALRNTSAIGNIDKEIYAAYSRALRSAQERMEFTFSDRMVPGAIGLVTGESTTLMATGVPLIGSVLGLASSVAADAIVRRFKYPKWLSFDERLRRETTRVNAASLSS